MKRLYNLDYLRGLAAFGIMIYHLSIWTRGEYNAENFMGKLGIYGVALFYVLSGMTMFIVYGNKMKPSVPDLKLFIKKRVLRIFPLMWLVTIATILVNAAPVDPLKVFLNLSGLFGFVSWYAYFAPGAWSIGNELVFYAFFPLFILLYKKYRSGFVLFSLLMFVIHLYFAFFILKEDIDLGPQWRNYVHPLNQVFLFLSGFIIASQLQNKNIKNSTSVLLLIISLLIFCFYPVSGNTIYLLTDFTRIVYTAVCIGICIAFYKLKFKLPRLLHVPLTFLGEASYSVYLLHPLVYNIVSKLITFVWGEDVISLALKAVISGMITLIAAYFVYTYFERYFMRLGRKGELHSGEAV